MLVAAAIGLMGIVRMVEIVAGAADGPVVAGGIVDAAGAVDGLVVAGGIAGAAGLAEEDTRASLPRIFADKHGRPRCESWPFLRLREKQVPHRAWRAVRNDAFSRRWIPSAAEAAASW